MPLFDAHLHLSDYPSPEEVVSLASWCGLGLLASSVDRLSSEKTLGLAQAHARSVLPFVGVHPSEAEKGRDVSWLRGALEAAAGLGEVGLDPKYSGVERGGAQLAVLESQLEQAQRAGKPVQVHSRGAETACLDVLGTFDLKSVLMHWFEGEDRLGTLADRGYFLSFGPALLYSKKLRRMASSCDRRMALTETDGPVAYAPLGGAHGPSLIPSVVFELARLWGTTFEGARQQVAENSLRYLYPGGKG